MGVCVFEDENAMCQCYVGFSGDNCETSKRYYLKFLHTSNQWPSTPIARRQRSSHITKF